MGPSHPDCLVNHAGNRARARVPRDRWYTPGTLGHWPESLRTPVRQHGTSYQGWSRPGQLVDHGPSDPDWRHLGQLFDPAGPQTWARVTQESWSTPLALGHGHELPGGTGRHRGPSDSSASRLGYLVDSMGPQTFSRVPGTAGRPHKSSDTSASGPGLLIDPA